jgi:hypothetical protein
MAHLAHRRLPSGTIQRPKVRAQIGDLSTDTGVLPQLLLAGVTQAQLQRLFRDALNISSPVELHQTVRGGVHQPVPRTFPKGDS